MANEYIGNPKTQSQIKRSQYLHDAITNLASSSKDMFNTAEGTNYNILANAILGYKSNQADNRADRMVKSDQDRLTAAILGTPEQANATALTVDKPMDLTPGGFEQRGQDVETNRLKAISEMGGPMAALQYQQGQAATKYQQDRDRRGDFVTDRSFDRGVLESDRGFDFTKDRAGVADDQFRMTFDQSGEQFGAKMNQDVDQFNQTMGLNRDQFGETVRHNRATEDITAAAAAAKAAAATKGNYTPTQQNKFIQQAQGLDSMQGSIREYKDLIDKAGPQLWTTGIGGDNPVAKQLQAARTAVLMQAKNLFELGVLNGPDLGLIDSTLPDVTGSNAIGKSPASAFSQMTVLDNYVDRGRKQIPPNFIELARPNGLPFKEYNDKQVAGATQMLSTWGNLSEAARATPQAQEARALAEKIVASANPQASQTQSHPFDDNDPIEIENDDDFDQLPSGAVYVGPDGNTYRKP